MFSRSSGMEQCIRALAGVGVMQTVEINDPKTSCFWTIIVIRENQGQGVAYSRCLRQSVRENITPRPVGA